MANLLFIEGLEIDFYNPRSAILFVCILQGVVFSALLFRRGLKQRTQADLWLGLLLVFFCASLITPFIGFANIYDRNQWLTYFPFGNAYIYGVLIYLYVRSLTDSAHRFKNRELLFFVPAAVYLIFRLVLFAQNLEFKNWFDENYYQPFADPIISATVFVWNAIFLVLSLKHYRKYRIWLNENFSDTEKVKFDWLRNFLYVYSFVFVLSGAFDLTDSFVFNLSYIQYFYFELVLALATYYLAVAGYLRSAPSELRFSLVAKTEKTQTRKAILSETEFQKLKTKLQNLMEDEKPFLNSQLTLGDLAKQLGVNSSVLSRIVNSGFEKNFNDFINEYRINEFKQKLRNGRDENLNLLGIAFDCGFNSKATFNRAFKKFANSSPKDFQETN